MLKKAIEGALCNLLSQGVFGSYVLCPSDEKDPPSESVAAIAEYGELGCSPRTDIGIGRIYQEYYSS
jgi:hypothetical protein